MCRSYMEASIVDAKWRPVGARPNITRVLGLSNYASFTFKRRLARSGLNPTLNSFSRPRVTWGLNPTLKFVFPGQGHLGLKSPLIYTSKNVLRLRRAMWGNDG